MNPRTRLFAWTGVWVLFLLPRLWMLRESAYYDEHWTMLEMDAPNLAEFWRRQSVSDPPSTLIPVYFTTQYLWSQVTGQSFLMARMFALLMSAGTGVVIWRIARRLLSERETLYAMALLAVSASHINYAVEVRLYPMTLLLAALSMLTFLRGLERRSWWPHFGVNVLLAWTHLMATSLFLVQWLWLRWNRKKDDEKFLDWEFWHVLMLVALLGWLQNRWNASVSDVALWITPPTISDFVVAQVVFAGGRPTNWAIGEFLPLGLSFDVVLLVAYAGLAGIAPRKRGKMNGLLVLWLVFPPLFLFVVSHIYQPIFLYRYCLYASSGLILLAGRGIGAISYYRLRYAVLGAILGMHLFQLGVLERGVRPDYAGASGHIASRMFPGDVVVGFKHYNADGLAYNDVSGALDPVTVESWDELIALLEEHPSPKDTVWVCFWRWDTLPEFEGALEEMGLAFVRKEFGGVPAMWLYEIYPAESD